MRLNYLTDGVDEDDNTAMMMIMMMRMIMMMMMMMMIDIEQSVLVTSVMTFMKGAIMVEPSFRAMLHDDDGDTTRLVCG